MRYGIEQDIADFDAFPRQGRADAPHDSGNPREKLAWRKGFGEVIVRAGIETADTIILCLARGKHDDRNMRGILVPSQAAADFDPAGTFDHPVQDNQVRHVFRCEKQGFIAIRRRADVVAFIGEAIFEQFGEGRIVLYQQ